MTKRRDGLSPPPLLAQSPQLQALTQKNIVLKNQGSCLVTRTFTFLITPLDAFEHVGTTSGSYPRYYIQVKSS